METATRIPKDVVILIDRTQSMEESGAFVKAKEAAKIVISTLNPRDKVLRMSMKTSILLDNSVS